MRTNESRHIVPLARAPARRGRDPDGRRRRRVRQPAPPRARSRPMSARELVVLGTASQVPTRYRNHNGYLLRWDDEGFLFDPGEGTQRQMIFAEVAATAVTRVCITHFHGDHCLGLAGVSQRISLDGAPHLVHAYYPASG